MGSALVLLGIAVPALPATQFTKAASMDAVLPGAKGIFFLPGKAGR